MKSQPKRVLLIRLSAIGDVALGIPLLYSVARQYPETEFTLLTRPFLIKLFINAPSNLKLIGVRKQETEKDLSDLFEVYRKLLRGRFDAVGDLHDVLRSKFLCLLLRTERIPVQVICKRREERCRLTRETNKELIPSMKSVDKYAEVFSELGFPVAQTFVSLFEDEPSLRKETHTGSLRRVGIAPFASHKGKVYPLGMMERVVAQLSHDPRFELILLGGRGEEAEMLEAWAGRYPRTISLAGKMDFDEELKVMNQLHLMVTMDSANMHLAALVNTPSLSIWGATHPYAGFISWNFDKGASIELDKECRPCSVYGNKPCRFGTYACMTELQPETIVEKIIQMTLLKPLH